MGAVEPTPEFERADLHHYFGFIRRIVEHKLMAALSGPRGTGKTWIAEAIQNRLGEIWRIRTQDARPVSKIEGHRMLAETGLLTPEDRDVFDRWWGWERADSIRRAKVVDFIHQRAEERSLPKDRLPERLPLETRPPKVAKITILPFSTCSGIIEAVHRAMFVTRMRTTPEGKWWAIRERLEAESWLLIFDEVDIAPPRILDTLRCFYDHNRTPTLLIGTEDLDGVLRDPRLLSLRHRIAIHERIGTLEPGDVRRLLTGWPRGVIDRVVAATESNFRKVAQIIDAVKLLEDGGAGGITHALLDEVLEVVPGLRPAPAPSAKTAVARQDAKPSRERNAVQVGSERERSLHPGLERTAAISETGRSEEAAG